MPRTHASSSGEQRLAELRTQWPKPLPLARLREAEPRVFRNAVWGIALIPVAMALLATHLRLDTRLLGEFALPSEIHWLTEPLSVASLTGAFMVATVSWLLLIRPRQLRRELTLSDFASAQGLSFAVHGAHIPAHGMLFAEDAKSSGSEHSTVSRYRSHLAMRDTHSPRARPDLTIALARQQPDKNAPKGIHAHFRFLQMRLPRPLPHLIIDARKGGRLRAHLVGVERVSLEGEFDRHFTVYVPDGYQRDALQLLTPDVMAVLIDHGRRWDIEIVEDQLVAASARVAARHDAAEITSLLLFALTVGTQVTEQAITYTDPRATRPRSQVALAGRRVKRRSTFWWATGVTIAAFVVIYGGPFLLGWLLDVF